MLQSITLQLVTIQSVTVQSVTERNGTLYRRQANGSSANEEQRTLREREREREH